MNPMPKTPPSFYMFISNDNLGEASRVPSDFVKNFIGVKDLEYGKPFALKRDGKSWLVVMIKNEDEFIIRSGWSDFVLEMGLEIGDLLVFRWVSKTDFEVEAFGRNHCIKSPTLCPGEKPKDQTPGAAVERVLRKEQIPGKGLTGKGREPERSRIDDKATKNSPRMRRKKVVPDPDPVPVPGQEISSGEIGLKHRNNRHQVLLPGAFVRKIRWIKSKDFVFIKDPKGEEFKVRISLLGERNQPYLSTGWNKVWESNGLTIGSSIALKYTHGSEGDELELEILSIGETVEGEAKSPEKKRKKTADVASTSTLFQVD